MMRAAVKLAEAQADGVLIIDLSKHCCNIKMLLCQKTKKQKDIGGSVRGRSYLDRSMFAGGYGRKGSDMGAGDVSYFLKR